MHRVGDVFDALVASTMPRARETAEIIAPALHDLAVMQDEGLCERHPGEADGMSWDDALEKYRFEDFEFVGYDPHPHIKAPVAV